MCCCAVRSELNFCGDSVVVVTVDTVYVMGSTVQGCCDGAVCWCAVRSELECCGDSVVKVTVDTVYMLVYYGM